MKRQIILMRMPNGILVDGPSLEKPLILEEMRNVTIRTLAHLR
jgi:hypothetical protein